MKEEGAEKERKIKTGREGGRKERRKKGVKGDKEGSLRRRRRTIFYKLPNLTLRKKGMTGDKEGGGGREEHVLTSFLISHKERKE